MAHKVVLIDDRDAAGAQDKLSKGKEKYALHEWVRFNEETFSDPSDAFKALVSYLRCPPMFAPGRVVYCFGPPFKRAEQLNSLAKQLPLIPDTISFVILARFDKLGAVLGKALKAMEQDGSAKIDLPVEVDKKNAVEWITAQAELLDLQIDKQACMVLADVALCNPGRIQNELRKLRWLTSNRMITAQMVMTAAFGEGEATALQIGDAILQGNMEKAHEYLQRLLDKGESVVMIASYFYDWAMRLAMAESCECNAEVLKMKAGRLRKWEGDGEGAETVFDDRYGAYSRPVGKQAPMYANPNSFYYTCRNLRDANKPAGWAFETLMAAGDIQVDIRRGHLDEARVLHEFVARAGGTLK